MQNDIGEGTAYAAIGSLLAWLKGLITLQITATGAINIWEVMQALVIVFLSAIVGTVTTHYVKRIFRIK
jgi:hypothetical protein